jgi:hypothetical protein
MKKVLIQMAKLAAVLPMMVIFGIKDAVMNKRGG